MREKMSLRQFERFALPTLKARLGYEQDAINKAIKNGFAIIDDDGVPIEYQVRCNGEPELDTKEIKDLVAQTVGEVVADLRGKKPMSRNPLGYHADDVGVAAKRGQVRAFKGPDAAKKALRFGKWALAMLGNEKAQNWCEGEGLVWKSGQMEGTNTLGGVLVPEEIDNDLIDLRLEYGVFRRNSRMRTMRSETLSVPRRTSGLSANFVGEAIAGASSNKTWNNITLTARKLMVLARISSEVNEDAVISLGDDLAAEIVYAFSYKEDLCGFLGDGTSTYGGIVGAVTALGNIWTSTSTSSAGMVIASGNAFSEVVLADLHGMVGRCPTFARRGAKWFASPNFVDSVLVRVALAVGGATMNDVVRGDTPSFLGYPVERCEVLPTTDVNSQVACLFGDLSQATSFGDRRQTTILISPTGTVDGSDVFASDQLAVRGTERFDINAHDVGDGTTAGAIIGLRMAAS